MKSSPYSFKTQFSEGFLSAVIEKKGSFLLYWYHFFISGGFDQRLIEGIGFIGLTVVFKMFFWVLVRCSAHEDGYFTHRRRKNMKVFKRLTLCVLVCIPAVLCSASQQSVLIQISVIERWICWIPSYFDNRGHSSFIAPHLYAVHLVFTCTRLPQDVPLYCIRHVRASVSYTMFPWKLGF